jgi:hypothetical protein
MRDPDKVVTGSVTIACRSERGAAQPWSQAAICAIAFSLVAWSGFAAPPSDVDIDSPLHDWFEHQHSVTGAWCCNVADGHVLGESDWRVAGGHYEVLINRSWHIVSATALRDPQGNPNPTGHAVVWWAQVGKETVILCFAPGNEL